MTVLIVGTNRFRIQFRHQSKLTKRPTLFRAPMNALTTCVVTIERKNEGAWDFRGVAIGHAMCHPGDNFSKAFARDTSFSRAVSDCAILKDVKTELVEAYDQAKPKSSGQNRSKYGARTKAAIANFLEKFAKEAGASVEETINILATAETIRTLGSGGRTRLSEEERQKLIEAGTPTRLKRSTPEGRAAVNAQKRSSALARAAG